MSRSQRTIQCQATQINLFRDTSRDLSVGSKSKSPSRVVKGIKLYNFSQIDSYRQIHQPSLQQDRRVSIEQQLDFKKSAEMKANKMIKKGKCFVRFDHNPFDGNHPHSKSAIIFRPQEPERAKSSRNIVHELNNLKYKNLRKQQISASLSKYKQEATRQSNLKMNDINKPKCNHTKSVAIEKSKP